MQYKLVGGRDNEFCDKVNEFFEDGWIPLREHSIPGFKRENPKDAEFLPFIMLILQKPEEKIPLSIKVSTKLKE